VRSGGTYEDMMKLLIYYRYESGSGDWIRDLMKKRYGPLCTEYIYGCVVSAVSNYRGRLSKVHNLKILPSEHIILLSKVDR